MIFLIISFSSILLYIAFYKKIGKFFNAISHYFLSDETVDRMLKPTLLSRFVLALLLTLNFGGILFSIYALTTNDFLPTFFFHSCHASVFQWKVYISNIIGLLFFISVLAIVISRLTSRIRQRRQERNPLHRSLVNLFPSLPSENIQMELLDPNNLKEVQLMINFNAEL